MADGYSEDGSWEIIKNLSIKYPNSVKILQIPQRGIYDAINNCINRSSGKYIYIATADDTMTDNCLEKMAEALEKEPRCDICHCCLSIIDSEGNKSIYDWDKYPAQGFYTNYINKKHIRLAPLDGLLHFGLGTIYTSLTQLLIRKSTFDKVGLFKNDWGPSSDFEWGMRASLVCNTIHIPLYLATWRKHPRQATPQTHDPIILRLNLLDMCRQAFAILEKNNPNFYKEINVNNLLDIYKDDILRIKIIMETQNLYKLSLILRLIFKRPKIVFDALKNKVIHFSGLPNNLLNNNVKRMRKIICNLNMDKNIIICAED